MNTSDNKLRKETKAKIQKAFIELLQSKEMREISISEICLSVGIDRSTFYAIYSDLSDLAQAIIKETESEMKAIGEQKKFGANNELDFGWIFDHIEKTVISFAHTLSFIRITSIE